MKNKKSLQHRSNENAFSILSLIISCIMLSIKQTFCDHRYRWISSALGRNSLSDKDILSEYEFQCIKCEKRLLVRMDRDVQINGEAEYVSCLVKTNNIQEENDEIL